MWRGRWKDGVSAVSPAQSWSVPGCASRLGVIVRRARNLVRDVVEACGASAHFLDNPLQRALRDLNTASCHTVFDLDLSSEIYGRLLVGLPANAPI